MASQSKPRIVLAEEYAPSAVERLRAAGEVVQLDDVGDAALRASVADADALLVRSYAQVTAELIAGAPRLKVIGRGGVGYENIDVSAAQARGIPVVHTPAASTRSVAEHTVGLLLAVERHIVAGHAAVQSGAFSACRKQTRLREVGDLTLGIVGMGRIGSAVGRIAALGLGMRILYNDIVDVGPFDFAAKPMTKAALYAQADVVTLHVPLTNQTRELIDAEALWSFKPEAVLVNTSRGAVVDAAAVAKALSDGHLGGVGLDVFDPEPLPADHPLLAAPNTVLTPHIASRSAAGMARMNDVVEDVIAVLEGREPRFPVASDSP